MTEPVIWLDAVRKEFGSVLAIDNVSLDIGAGEFVSLLGPSGCGKSTLLKMIAGLLQPTSGRIDMARPTQPGEQALGFVFQEPTLMPWTSVAENVRLPLRLAGLDRASVASRVQEALEAVGLGQFARAFPRQLSGGMKMRVSIARALVTRPRILLMDEPFAALDEITRTRLNDDVLALAAANGLTVVFVTHSVFESVYLSNRVVVLAARPGRLVRDIPISAPWPRDEAFRTSAAYAEHCRVVSSVLRTTLRDEDVRS